jgi:hypothetical protein
LPSVWLRFLLEILSFLFQIDYFQDFHIFIDFLLHILHGLSFIHLFVFSWSSFICLFISSLRSDTSFCVSYLSSLIILTIVFWNSLFDISFSSLFRSLIGGVGFWGRDVASLLHVSADLSIWGCFWFGLPVPCAPVVEVLWRIVQTGWMVVELWCVFLSLGDGIEAQ